MRSLREVKTQIYQTECGKYLKRRFVSFRTHSHIRKGRSDRQFFPVCRRRKRDVFWKAEFIVRNLFRSVQNGISDGRVPGWRTKYILHSRNRKGKELQRYMRDMRKHTRL